MEKLTTKMRFWTTDKLLTGQDLYPTLYADRPADDGRCLSPKVWLLPAVPYLASLRRLAQHPYFHPKSCKYLLYSQWLHSNNKSYLSDFRCFFFFLFFLVLVLSLGRFRYLSERFSLKTFSGGRSRLSSATGIVSTLSCPLLLGSESRLPLR